LAGFLVISLVAARPLRLPRPLPAELIFYLPVAGLFVACGLTENRNIAIATSVLAAGGGLLLLASTLATARRLEHGPLPLRDRIARALPVAIAALALLYVAVYASNLTDLVAETLAHGPDR
jgi:hypothetical protein